MTESLLEKFNKGVKSGIKLTQEDIKTLETIGVDDISEIDRVGPIEVIQEIGKPILWFIVGKPAKTTEPLVEGAVAVLSSTEKKLESEIESIETGREAIEYAKRAIIRSRLKKRLKDAAQFGANQIEYISSSTETSIEPFLEKMEQPLAGTGTAVGDYAATATSLSAKNMIEGVGETTIGLLESIKNIPFNVSEFAKSHIPDPRPYFDNLWSFIDSMSDFFYIFCALVILGKFDFLLENTYLVLLVTMIIVYTIRLR